jgi:hypothetical protein
MHAATIELLVQKAHLDPDTAIAIATAIDMALQNAQLVTVAVLDARLAAVEAKQEAALAKTKAELFRWGVYLVVLGNVALSMAANAVLNAFQHLR